MLENSSNILVMFVGFLVAALMGNPIIGKLKTLGVGQSIREEGPESHLSKSGTPTMGGLIMLVSLLVTLLVFSKDIITVETLILLIATLGFGLIGFLDDYIIIKSGSNQGLTANQKIVLQTLLALVIAFYQAKWGKDTTKVIIPFAKIKVDLGLFYIPFVAFVIVGTVNSVNLTDGLDGLASGVTMIVLSFFASVAILMNFKSVAVFSSALAGACLGFLIFNFYPAKVFMGDTGSLGLGGAVSSIAVITNLPLMIPIVGGIYLVEALSVIIQVTSFKLTGKRVFLMSPLHHHFEEKGWKEKKVVLVFWSVTLILCIIGFISIS